MVYDSYGYVGDIGIQIKVRSGVASASTDLCKAKNPVNTLYFLVPRPLLSPGL